MQGVHEEVKKRADAHDIRGLRYIFVDSLDVDPTFEKYKEDYEYCKENIKDFFDKPDDLKDLTKLKSQWKDKNYWAQLKENLMQNFSEERFEHMKKVAKEVHAEKVERLKRERKLDKERSNITHQNKPNSPQTQREGDTSSESKEKFSRQETENKRIEDLRKNFNSNFSDINKTNSNIIKNSNEVQRIDVKKNESMLGKKWMGVALAIISLLILGLVLASQVNSKKQQEQIQEEQENQLQQEQIQEE